MPYFVYQITHKADSNTKELEALEIFDNYKEARAMVRGKRAEGDLAADQEVRMIFAKNSVEAEKILSAPREERVIGED